MTARRSLALSLMLAMVLCALPAQAGVLDGAAEQIRQAGDAALSFVTRYNWLMGAVGLILILYGYRIYFLVVALAGIVLGGTFGYELVGGPLWAALAAALVGALLGGAVSVALHGVAIFAAAAVPGYMLGMKFGGALLWGILGGLVTGVVGVLLMGIGVAAATSFAGGLILSRVIFGSEQMWFAITCIFIGLILQGLTVGFDGREEKASGLNMLRRWKRLFRKRAWNPLRRRRPDPKANVPSEAYRED